MVKIMAVEEFRKLGFLQEVNRLFLHPRGCALEIVIEDDGTERLGRIWDEREDPEGIVFASAPDANKAGLVERERKAHEKARIALLGQEIQQVGQAVPCIPTVEKKP
jgi:hypothetical protein